METDYYKTKIENYKDVKEAQDLGINVEEIEKMSELQEQT